MSAPGFNDDEKRDILTMRIQNKSWREIADSLNKNYRAYNKGGRIWRSVQRKYKELIEDGEALVTMKIPVKTLNNAKLKGITKEQYPEIFEKGLASYP